MQQRGYTPSAKTAKSKHGKRHMFVPPDRLTPQVEACAARLREPFRSEFIELQLEGARVIEEGWDLVRAAWALYHSHKPHPLPEHLR